MKLEVCTVSYTCIIIIMIDVCKWPAHCVTGMPYQVHVHTDTQTDHVTTVTLLCMRAER